MKLSEVIDILDARVVCGDDMLDREVRYGFASDMMSDVLTLDTENMLLITGLSNLQTIRTAEMADIAQIVIVRNKIITPEMRAIACENNMVLLSSTKSMFRAIGLLYKAGLEPIY
jgi:hypothetical protein